MSEGEEVMELTQDDVLAICNHLLDLVEKWAERYYGANGLTDFERSLMITHTMNEVVVRISTTRLYKRSESERS
jgi:hypothetical protein